MSRDIVTCGEEEGALAANRQATSGYGTQYFSALHLVHGWGRINDIFLHAKILASAEQLGFILPKAGNSMLHRIGATQRHLHIYLAGKAL